MARALEFVSFDWKKHDKKLVTVNGRQCILRVNIWTAIFPHRHEVIDVIADPVDKESHEYLYTKKKLGDDWHYAVLNDWVVEEQIIDQLGGE